MVPLRRVLLGRPRSRLQWALDVLVILTVLTGTFGAYALGLFQVSGGVVVLPAAATLVGFVVAVGYLGRSSIERLRGRVVSQQSHD